MFTTAWWITSIIWVLNWIHTGWGCRQRRISISSLASAAPPPLRCFGAGSNQSFTFILVNVELYSENGHQSAFSILAMFNLCSFPWHRALQRGGSHPEYKVFDHWAIDEKYKDLFTGKQFYLGGRGSDARRDFASSYRPISCASHTYQIYQTYPGASHNIRKSY